VAGDDVLVRGDDRFAGTERRRDERMGGLVAAHELDDHVRVRRPDKMGRCVGQQLTGDARCASSIEVAAGDTGKDHGGAVGGRDTIGSLQDAADDGATDRAGAEDGDTERRAGHLRDTP
jgi:hypothetical protein